MSPGYNAPSEQKCSDVRSGTVSDAIEQLYREIDTLISAKNILSERMQKVLTPPNPCDPLGKNGSTGNSALSSAIYEAAMQIRSLRRDIEDIDSRMDL